MTYPTSRREFVRQGVALGAALAVTARPRALAARALEPDPEVPNEQIARLLKERHFAKGETIIMEGSGGAAFFIIDSGQAAVSSKGTELATLGPGDYFGEVALIDGGARTATVKAATDLVCYGLTFWEFRPLVEGNGAIAWKLLQALAKRLRGLDSK